MSAALKNNRNLELVGFAPDRARDHGGAAAAARQLPPQPGGQVPDLRLRRRRPRAVLGLHGHPEPRPGRVLRPRRLLHGDVSQARGVERREHQDPVDAGHSGFHGLEPAHRAAVLLGSVQVAAVRAYRRRSRCRCSRPSSLAIAMFKRRVGGRLLRHHHPGARRGAHHPDRRTARATPAASTASPTCARCSAGTSAPTTRNTSSISSAARCCSASMLLARFVDREQARPHPGGGARQGGPGAVLRL